MYSAIASRILLGSGQLGHQEALSILQSSEEEFLPLLDAAYRVRKHFHGNRVHIHVLENAKQGACPEDCKFCSQSKHFESPGGEAPHKEVTELLDGAARAVSAQAKRYCMVTATHGPNARDLKTICDAAKKIKETYPGLQLCASLGFLTDEKASKLKSAGIDRFNHNIETSENNFPNVVTTHTYQDRVATINTAKRAGLETCAGGIIGLGESDQDLVDMAFALREIGVDSIPVNFLNPRPGTPFSQREKVTPRYAIRALCLFRLANPSADIRVAGGREVVLKSMQSLALYPANSLFSSGYLTTGGAEPDSDRQMIKDAGFVIETDLPVLASSKKLPVVQARG